MDGPELSCTALYFTSHHSSKEGQLWRGLQNADGLAEGSLQGRWGLELHCRHQLSPRALVRGHLCHCLSSVEWHYTPTQTLPHPELSCTLGRSRGTHSTKESITSHTIHCWKGKIDHCSCGNKSCSRLSNDGECGLKGTGKQRKNQL